MSLAFVNKQVISDVYTWFKTDIYVVLVTSTSCVCSELSRRRADVTSPLLLKLSTRCLRAEESPVKFLFHCPCLWASGCPVYPYFWVLGGTRRREGHLQKWGNREGRNSQMHTPSGLLGNMSMVTVKQSYLLKGFLLVEIETDELQIIYRLFWFVVI